MAATQDHAWEQGEDLIIEIVYKMNDTEVPLDSEGYAVRMDIAPLAGAVPGTPVFSFNSDDFTGPLDTAGDVDNEIVFPSELPGTIHVVVPRALTLAGGVIGDELPLKNTYGYDLFLRDKLQNTQKKLLKGKIVVSPSITHWA